ncbi:MAG: hypothetical protein H6577_17630 [Lewinellaceae bacterium]|nr:hypothetical protein [Saprospiraceae bacterium]MCB9339949.1 hypothetical protein [Lewinellaceae bacterium]
MALQHKKWGNWETSKFQNRICPFSEIIEIAVAFYLAEHLTKRLRQWKKIHFFVASFNQTKPHTRCSLYTQLTIGNNLKTQAGWPHFEIVC